MCPSAKLAGEYRRASTLSAGRPLFGHSARAKTPENPAPANGQPPTASLPALFFFYQPQLFKASTLHLLHFPSAPSLPIYQNGQLCRQRRSQDCAGPAPSLRGHCESFQRREFPPPTRRRQLLTFGPHSLSTRTSTTRPRVSHINWSCAIAADDFVAALEVKLKAPNNVNFTAKGTSAHDGPVSSSVRISDYMRHWQR